MPVLSDLEPREVFAWFERLCAIPHGSHHAKAISDYLVAFARERGLACRQDAANNVVIRKAASAGYENAPVVMLQGHIDMVCEKDADCGKDMETEGLDLFVDGDVIGARGTTLGGDDGIAVAMALAAALRAEYHAADGHITVTVTETDDGLTPMDAASTERAITLLLCAPNGVVEMSMDVPGLVQTSLNLGRLTSDEASLRASFMIRSSINSQKNAVASRLARLAEALGGQTELDSDYSAWPYRPESPLRDRVAEVFYEQYGEKPRIAALHAGLECGILSGKLPELDCISLGPDLTDIHTPRERLHIASTERTWRLLLGTLKRLDA